jgi:hypothetical protein
VLVGDSDKVPSEIVFEVMEERITGANPHLDPVTFTQTVFPTSSPLKE